MAVTANRPLVVRRITNSFWGVDPGARDIPRACDQLVHLRFPTDLVKYTKIVLAFYSTLQTMGFCCGQIRLFGVFPPFLSSNCRQISLKRQSPEQPLCLQPHDVVVRLGPKGLGT